MRTLEPQDQRPPSSALEEVPAAPCSQCSLRARHKSLVEHYEVYRDYLKHEDALINYRLSWNLSAHAFLVAAFGYQVVSLLEPSRNKPVPLLVLAQTMLILIPVAGISISCFGKQSVDAALAAIDRLTNDWKRIYRLRDIDLKEPGLKLPRLSGGGSAAAERRGAAAPRFTVRALLWIWWILEVVTIGCLVAWWLQPLAAGAPPLPTGQPPPQTSHR